MVLQSKTVQQTVKISLMSNIQSSWLCPSCHNVIALDGRTWRCENNHCYDVAKEGYMNLLLAQHKNSKEPGDNKQMINARREFLEQGHYQPLAQHISELFANYVEQQDTEQPFSFFDAGCGEGYYLNSVSQYIKSANVDCTYSGIDISKIAVQKAAKKYQSNQFAVASTFQLPVRSQSQDAVLQIFAPSSEKEIHRVLKTAGIWITVNPSNNHLQEVKTFLYDKPTENKESASAYEGFELMTQTNLSYTLPLGNEKDRHNLLMMTPYYWSATLEKKQTLLQKLESVTPNFDIKVFSRA